MSLNATAAPGLSIGRYSVSGLGVTAVAYTLADRMAHYTVSSSDE
jgi:hypothetical protein